MSNEGRRGRGGGGGQFLAKNFKRIVYRPAWNWLAIGNGRVLQGWRTRDGTFETRVTINLPQAPPLEGMENSFPPRYTQAALAQIARIMICGGSMARPTPSRCERKKKKHAGEYKNRDQSSSIIPKR